jgi:IclR family acetate operon transcriptional repressor
MEPERLDKLLSKGQMTRFTAHTIIDPKALRQNLKAIRESGFSVDNEERNEGMRCIAAPVFDMNGEAVAGISISGPTSRVGASEVEELSRPVIKAAHQLSLAIGGSVTGPQP